MNEWMGSKIIKIIFLCRSYHWCQSRHAFNKRRSFSISNRSCILLRISLHHNPFEREREGRKKKWTRVLILSQDLDVHDTSLHVWKVTPLLSLVNSDFFFSSSCFDELLDPNGAVVLALDKTSPRVRLPYQISDPLRTRATCLWQLVFGDLARRPNTPIRRPDEHGSCATANH